MKFGKREINSERIEKDSGIQKENWKEQIKNERVKKRNLKRKKFRKK